MDILCRVIRKPNGKLEYSSVRTDDDNILKEDKKYGFLQPKNGILTFSVTNRDGEISEKGVDRAIKFALKEWSLYVPIEFKKVPLNGDIRVEFRNEEDDDILTPNVLAYMYYPLGGKNNGLCVVNTRYYWTNSGNGINMSKIDPTHYDIKTNVMGKTWDLDQVLRHEFGHGVFGLPHDTQPTHIMSSNYGIMMEHLSETDILRARAKAGIKELQPHILSRWLNWLKKSSDRDY